MVNYFLKYVQSICKAQKNTVNVKMYWEGFRIDKIKR